MTLPNLAARIFTTPLMIAPDKLDAILGVVGPRLGLDVAPAPAGPVTEPKQRADAQLLDLVEDDEEDGQASAAAKVAVVQVVGTLANRVDWLDAMSGMTSYETLGAEIDRLAADPEVAGILLEVDSFGGEAAGCFDCADRIAAARELKPVYGVANQYAMSAGYALLSQCDKVFVPQGGEVGSIGVVATHVDMTRAAEDAGVRVTHIHAGKHKVDMSQFRALSDETRDRLQASIQEAYENFATVVARGGRADAEAAKATEALTYRGEKAVEAGLADAVGTKLEALEGLNAEIKERDRMKSKKLEAQLAQTRTALDASRAETAKLRGELKKFLDAEEARQKAEDGQYVEWLRQRSAETQSPIPEAKLAKVEEHMKAGRRDFARELGDVLLEAAVGTAQAKFTLKAPAERVAPKAPKDDHHKAVVSGYVTLLKTDGCTDVEVTTSETKSTVSFTDRSGTKREKTFAREG